MENSRIPRLRFEYGSNVPVAEGTLVEVPIGTVRVLYQIVQGVTDTELLESKNETGLIIGEAAQLGTWNPDTLAFDRFGWVPEMNAPVYLASSIEAVHRPQAISLSGIFPTPTSPFS